MRAVTQYLCESRHIAQCAASCCGFHSSGRIRCGSPRSSREAGADACDARSAARGARGVQGEPSCDRQALQVAYEAMFTTSLLYIVLVIGPFLGHGAPVDRGRLESIAKNDPLTAGELLRQAAEQGQLTDPLAEIAAGLLGHEDPFVRALAEWAIATRVAGDNNGQTIVWPKEKAPSWFITWSQLPAESFVELDYCRQGIVWGLHRDAQAIQASADKIVRRAEGVLAWTGAGGDVEELRALRDDLKRRIAADPARLDEHRRTWLKLRQAARPVVLEHSPVDFERLLFVSGFPGHSLRNITGSQYPWAHKPGGDLCVQDGPASGRPAQGVIAGRLGPGHVHGMDLWWDADRIVSACQSAALAAARSTRSKGIDSFQLRTDQEPTHLYEIAIGGAGPRRDPASAAHRPCGVE